MIKWENEIENLKNLIEKEKLAYDTIGKKYGVSGAMIRKVWKNFGFILESRRKINKKETFNKGKKIKQAKRGGIGKVKSPKPNETKLYCIVCGKELKGKQRKYCSKTCKQKDLSNKKYHTKYSQKKDSAGINEKINLIKEKGGKCELCGYKKNISALCFHHINPLLKNFTVDARNIARRSKEKIKKELENCQLLCQNCHHEIHHPKYNNIL